MSTTRLNVVLKLSVCKVHPASQSLKLADFINNDDEGSGDGVTRSDANFVDADLFGLNHVQKSNTQQNVSLIDDYETDLDEIVDSRTDDHNIGDGSGVLEGSDSDSVTQNQHADNFSVHDDNVDLVHDSASDSAVYEFDFDDRQTLRFDEIILDSTSDHIHLEKGNSSKLHSVKKNTTDVQNDYQKMELNIFEDSDNHSKTEKITDLASNENVLDGTDNIFNEELADLSFEETENSTDNMYDNNNDNDYDYETGYLDTTNHTNDNDLYLLNNDNDTGLFRDRNMNTIFNTSHDLDEIVEYETLENYEITTVQGTETEKSFSKVVSTKLMPTTTDETSGGTKTQMPTTYETPGETTTQNTAKIESSDQNHLKISHNADHETVSNLTFHEVQDNYEVKQTNSKNSANDSKSNLSNNNVKSAESGSEEETQEIPAFRLDADMLDGITETVYQISRPSAFRQINLKK